MYLYSARLALCNMMMHCCIFKCEKGADKNISVLASSLAFLQKPLEAKIKTFYVYVYIFPDVKTPLKETCYIL